MKEKNRNLLVTALICLLVIVCFTFLRIDTTPQKRLTSEEEKSPAPDIKRVSEEGDVIVPESYAVILKDDSLKFYMIIDKEQVILESVKISEKLFPEEDIKALKNGIFVETLEEGIGIIEDFTS